MGTLLGPFWLKWVHNLCGPQVGGLRMEPVVTQEDSVGDLTEVFFLLVLSWVVTGFAGFLPPQCRSPASPRGAHTARGS